MYIGDSPKLIYVWGKAWYRDSSGAETLLRWGDFSSCFGGEGDCWCRCFCRYFGGEGVLCRIGNRGQSCCCGCSCQWSCCCCCALSLLLLCQTLLLPPLATEDPLSLSAGCCCCCSVCESGGGGGGVGDLGHLLPGTILWYPEAEAPPCLLLTGGLGVIFRPASHETVSRSFSPNVDTFFL